MKMASALVLAGLVACTQANPICLPNIFKWRRSGTFQDWQKGFKGGYDQAEEIIDHNQRKYRYITAFEGVDGAEMFQDMIVDAKAQKAWILTGKKGSGSIDCKVVPAHNVNPHPCLLNNATLAGSGLVAGNLYTNVFVEAANHVYLQLGITAGTEVPIFSRIYVPGDEYANEELYFDYSTQLGPEPFRVPGICPVKASGAPLKQSDLPKGAEKVLTIE